MKDKIIQITDTIDSEAEGQTLGLSQSGKLYILRYKKVNIDQSILSTTQKFKWVPDCWELLIDSPEIK
jgi:hypothetical protein